MSRPQSEPNSPLLLDALACAVACAIVFFVPFVPDEKLVRLKLEVLEFGALALAAVAGVRVVLAGTKWRPMDTGVVAWLGVTTALWYASPDRAEAGIELRRVVLAATLYLAMSWTQFNAAWKRRWLFSWWLAATLMALYGLLQHQGGIGPILVPQWTRIIGTYGNPIFFGGFLATSILVSIDLCSRERSFLRTLIVSGIFVQLIACYLTQSRAVWAALAIAVVIGLVLRHGVRGVPTVYWLVMLALGSLFLVKTRDVWLRDQSHLLIWRDTIRMWRDHPFVGVGLGTFHTNFIAYAGADLKAKYPIGQFIVNDAHNEYLQILSETGLVGLISFIAIPFVFFRRRPASAAWLLAAVAFIFLQNLASVDMRFAISLGSCFLLMGFVDSADASPRRGVMTATQVGVSAIWVLFLGGVALPALLKPYRAQRAVALQANFFDERVLDPAKTVADLENLSARYPNEPAVLEKLAYVYAKEIKTREGKINGAMAAKAIDAYERLVRIDPKRIGAYNNLANIEYTIGQTDRAIEIWNKALEVDPNFIDIHLNLGKIYYMRGQLKESAAHFEKALKIDPNNAEAAVYLKRMVE